MVVLKDFFLRTVAQSSYSYKLGCSVLFLVQQNTLALLPEDRNHRLLSRNLVWCSTTVLTARWSYRYPWESIHTTSFVLNNMVLDQTWSDQERLVALRYLSRGFSRHDILRHVWAECGREYSDDQLKQMLDNEDIRERQGSFLLLTDVQQQGPKWDLDAIDRVVNDIKGRPPSGSADELMNTRGADEESVLVVCSNGFLFFHALC